MNAEVITIGDEILIGQTTDTNSQWIGEQLNKIGVSVYQISTIQDDKQHILNALKEAENRVKAGLLLREIINKEKFSLSKENIDNWLDTISRGQGNRAEIENYYMNNEDAKKNMESVILENLAVKWVIKNASVNEKNYTFDDLVELR